jgi:cell division protein FtsI/penicillin-binding protein 2
MLKRVAGVAVLAVIVVAGWAVRGGGTSPEPTIERFLLYWESGQYRQAAALTTGSPKTVASELAGAYQQLDATDLVLSMNHVIQQGSSATAIFNASVDLGSSGLQWQYTNRFALRESGSTWRVVWSPSVIAKGLATGDRLAVVLETQGRAQINAASGQPLGTVSKTYEVGVVPAELHGVAEVEQIANRLAAVLHLQDQAAQIAGQIEASPSGFRELVTLTPDEYAAMRHKLDKIPGLEVRQRSQRLFKSIAPDVVGSVGTETASILREQGVQYRPGTTVGLSGLESFYQRQLVGQPTTIVVIENSRGQGVIDIPGATWPGQRARPVDTTLQYGVQQAANGALAQVSGSGALVAVQANTGKILAVASHQGRGEPALDPLNGAYEPGQSFTIVSTAAFLAAGLTPNSVVPCNASNSVDGHSFRNEPPTSNMGQTPQFSKDFTVGCSTAFAGYSESTSAGDLAVAAREFGIGSQWQLPLPGYPGTIGQPSGEVGVAADAIGQGTVRASPLSMALAAAVAESGSWHAPSLVAGQSQSQPSVTAKTTMSAQVLSELKGLMRAAAQHGAGISDLYGQAGVAPFSAHPRLYISWFVGYQGTTAFAVAELVHSPSDAASALAGAFLRNIQAGS